jgi:hypothetical protein
MRQVEWAQYLRSIVNTEYFITVCINDIMNCKLFYSTILRYLNDSMVLLSDSEFQTWLSFSVDPSKPFDFKEAYDITEPDNNNFLWPDGDCSDFKETIERFFESSKQLTYEILDLICLGLKLNVSILLIQ